MEISVLTVKHKHIQHTVNPLIAPHVNPFLPSAIGTVSVVFFSTDHCIGVTGDVSDTKSIPPSVRMPAAVPQSRYKLLIIVITSKKKKKTIPVSIPPFVNAITFT
ncbi:unnamed protein product [Staurois parvus]|uniref:Uncharacterized protein n=1 Tax=Staurois parvus TaxID=386267 RepID=A0ABN9CT00_9NEOB|nr:unnamed protein product [Staurois parvus]